MDSLHDLQIKIEQQVEVGVKQEPEENSEKIIQVELKNHQLFVFSQSKRGYFLTTNHKINFGDYLLQKNGFVFFKRKLPSFLYALYDMQVISSLSLKKYLALNEKVKGFVFDLYRIYKQRKTTSEVLNIARKKVKSKNVIFLLEEHHSRKYNYIYWGVNVLFIQKYKENVSYSGITFLEIHAKTGKVVSYY